MTKKLLALAIACLPACTPAAEPLPPKETTSAIGAPSPAPLTAAARARTVKESNDLFDFIYSWPAAAAAIAPLNQRLESELARDRTEALAMARDDKTERGAEVPFNGHYLAKEWAVHGETERLLSLAAEVATFTGGAHGNATYDQILWDKSNAAAISPADLFIDPEGAFEALSKTYCAALDKERAEKRQETLPLDGEGWGVDCPALAQQRIVPTGKGRFGTLEVLIPPYEAGPYAEGSYEISIPITEAARNLIKPEYRLSFKP